MVFPILPTITPFLFSAKQGDIMNRPSLQGLRRSLSSKLARAKVSTRNRPTVVMYQKEVEQLIFIKKYVEDYIIRAGEG